MVHGLLNSSVFLELIIFLAEYPYFVDKKTNCMGFRQNMDIQAKKYILKYTELFL